MTKVGMIIEQEKQEAVRKAVEETRKQMEEQMQKEQVQMQKKQEQMQERTEKSERGVKILRSLLHGKTVAETAAAFGVSEQEVIELRG